VLGGGVEEDLLGQGEDGDTRKANSGDQVDHVLALVLVIDLLPGLGGDAHLLDAGPGPVGDGLAPSGDHHQARAGQKGTSDHCECVDN